MSNMEDRSIISIVVRPHARTVSKRTTIPLKIAAKAGLEVGDELVWELKNGKLIATIIKVSRELKG